jgi:hypothetical protein
VGSNENLQKEENMKVKLVILGEEGARDLDVNIGATIGDLLKTAGIELKEEADDEKGKAMVLLNGAPTEVLAVIPENAVITVVPNIKGGN